MSSDENKTLRELNFVITQSHNVRPLKKAFGKAVQGTDEKRHDKCQTKVADAVRAKPNGL